MLSQAGEVCMSSTVPGTGSRVVLDAATKSRMDQAIARETRLSRLLMTYIVTGLLFMLFPGTFLGVWNLISISKRQAVDSITPAWIQAHGHAQLFGWVGTFILGIGFYSIPKLRRLKPFAMWEGWACWAIWSTGVTLRWTINIHPWHWRILLPTSAALELLAFLIFFRAVSTHRQSGAANAPWQAWIYVVIAATLGLLLTLALNLWGAVAAARGGQTPAFPHVFDQRFLFVSTWGFLVPMVWGFSSRWLPVFLGLRPLRPRLLTLALVLNTAGVLAALLGQIVVCVVLLLAGSLCAANAIRLFEPAERRPKVVGVHPSFPVFVRVAYVWLNIAALLGIWAALDFQAAGIWGASRHALTVGFIAAMVFSVGQRILPSFCGMRVLYSPRLMFAALALLMTGCTLRVASEILAYQNYAAWAWYILPVSALLEMTAVTLFAVNLAVTFIRPPVVVQGPLSLTVE
jgi:uncharacterized protein involved in response to NO